MRNSRVLLVRLIVTVSVAALLACAARAADVAAAWRSVSRVHGVIALERHDWIHEPTTKYDRNESVHIEFTMVADRSHGTTSMIWRAESASVTGSIRREESAIPYGSSTQAADIRGTPSAMNSFTLTLDPRTGAWQLASPGFVREKYQLVTQFFGDDPSTTTEIENKIESGLFDGTVTGQPGATRGAYKEDGTIDRKPTRGYAKHGQLLLWPEFDDVEVEVTIDGYDEWRPRGSIAHPTTMGNSVVARATLKSKEGKTKDLPEVDRFRFELIDTSREPGVCLNWPLGAKDEDFDLQFADPAASASGRSEAVRKFFADWGLMSGGDYDAASLPPGPLPSVTFGEVSENGQKFELSAPPKDKEGRPFADAMVESFDFGAKSELRVTCFLEDGREIIGLMKGKNGEQDLVRLPKRAGPDWVADVWRKEKGATNLAADDDNEKVEGQQDNGDGFTLYEEYRGWVENGKHIDGDPKRKDFFVRNIVGADAKGGIALFERVSKLRVHAKLRASEIIDLPVVETEAVANAKGERIMNWNHRDAPHRVDQHAVIMISASGFGNSGGGTEGVRNNDKTERALRPGKARVIHIEERGGADGVFSRGRGTTAYNLSERDAAFAYDRGVAHELLHSVGVDHHGEGEHPEMFYFQGAGDPMNTAHRPRFVTRSPTVDVSGHPAAWSDFDRGPTITLLWEDTGEDVAQSASAEFERELSAERANPVFERDGSGPAATFAQLGRDALFWSEMEIYNDVASGRTNHGLLYEGKGPNFHRFVIVGREREADSGNELCLMRYYFATAYPVPGRENTYYLVRPGGNRAGRELCKSPEGTGANASDHRPKSRFGDSAPGRGGCFRYICPNDAIPGRTL